MATPWHGARPRNRILAALPRDELERVGESLEAVELETRVVLIEPYRTIEEVHFIENGVVSIVGLSSAGAAVETATVGYEGMIGVPVFLGAMSMAGQAFVQVPGSALRMSSGELREEVRRGSVLADLLGRYTQALLTMIAQASACNRLHPVENRCARWLLMTHDRISGDTFELTQLFLAQMLGVRRASVNEVAGRLRDRGLIDYERGTIRILDRASLEAQACECYGLIRDEFARLLEGRSTHPSLRDGKFSKDGRSTAGSPGDEPGPGPAD